ncbi:hypothetical protein NDU88_007781 [Pleurodeles waltl]|uniref:Uncharacterized protein n=1 Tax=Pleurodeles waltl TaxID=8319 RepID=A0AAV7STD1_PLEWA|nr:hypothetical protein NDU88_007781 [Pleurodeles waltl]
MARPYRRSAQHPRPPAYAAPAQLFCMLQRVGAQHQNNPVSLGLLPRHRQSVAGLLTPQMAPDKPGTTQSFFSSRPPLPTAWPHPVP